MNRLSACLITSNEEHNLPRALRSLEGVADEIVVVDCGSRDRTQETARRSEEHTSELQSLTNLVCRLLLEKKKKKKQQTAKHQNEENSKARVHQNNRQTQRSN